MRLGEKKWKIWDRVKKDAQEYWKAVGLLFIYMAAMNVVFHQFCPMVFFTGLPCPGCGITRAFRLLLQLRFQEAWNMHPFVYGWVILGIVFCVRRYGMGKEIRTLQKYGVILLIGMFVFYIFRMLVFFPDKEPMTYFSGNLCETILKKWKYE